MSGKKPILAMAQGIPRIHVSAPAEVHLSADSESSKPGYQQLVGEKYAAPSELHSTTLTIDPRLLKQKEAEGYLNEIQAVDQNTIDYKFAYSQHSQAKASVSVASRVINMPNLTTDRPAQYPKTCTKSVHKVVFLFCSVTLAVIIACIILVEMKKMQEDEREY